jgi:hypothetical protein
MLRQRLLIGASGLCGGVKSSAPTVRYTPDVANASSLRVIAASIAALMRSDPTSAAFPVPGVMRGRPRLATPRINSIAAMTEKQLFRLRENTRQRSSIGQRVLQLGVL